MPRLIDNAELGALKDQLEAQVRAIRLERIDAIHTASLRDPHPLARQAAS